MNVRLGRAGFADDGADSVLSKLVDFGKDIPVLDVLATAGGTYLGVQGATADGQSLAVALAPYRIAVATVAPGFIETDMTNEHLKAERGEAIRGQSPFRRVARPAEIAAAVHFLASPAAEWASAIADDELRSLVAKAAELSLARRRF